jgi:hypothetical protein
MTNDEIPNDEGMPKSKARIRDFNYRPSGESLRKSGEFRWLLAIVQQLGPELSDTRRLSF